MIAHDTTGVEKPFERVATGMRSRILDGTWRPGSLLPGRRALAAEYGVAGATLERAVALLSAEGLLSISDRRGTFVAEGLPGRFSMGRPTFPAPAHGVQPLVATVGIVVAVVPLSDPVEYANQWPLQILHGCEHRLAGESGLTMRVLHSQGGGGTLPSSTTPVQQLLDAGATAIILIGTPPTLDFTAHFASTRVPLVFAEYERQEHPFPQVYADDVAAGALAARHLLERGYRHLLYFQPFAVDWVAERLAGVRLGIGVTAAPPALKALPVETVPLRGREHDQRAIALRRAQEVLDTGWERGMGVIAPNDSVAAGFIDAARERGFEPGRDYGIIGFDDRRRDYGLTSLRPPLRELGEEAAGLAIRLLRGESAPARVALHHRLIARETTAPWKPDAVGRNS